MSARTQIAFLLVLAWAGNAAGADARWCKRCLGEHRCKLSWVLKIRAACDRHGGYSESAD